ncbi:hypothetical protein D6C95_01883 [Aureobasidium pullulans]|nr:hypothetical protein D6C95_01883 [Aureobasidium pullulans]
MSNKISATTYGKTLESFLDDERHKADDSNLVGATVVTKAHSPGVLFEVLGGQDDPNPGVDQQHCWPQYAASLSPMIDGAPEGSPKSFTPRLPPTPNLYQQSKLSQRTEQIPCNSGPGHGGGSIFQSDLDISNYPVDDMLMRKTDILSNMENTPLAAGVEVSSRTYRKRMEISKSPSPRAQRASATLDADETYVSGVEINAETVRDVIFKHFVREDTQRLEQVGFVYVFRDEELGLVKIGHAGNIEQRKRQIEQRCRTRKSLIYVTDSGEVPAYKALEEILHQDLAPHRWKFDCDCKKPLKPRSNPATPSTESRTRNEPKAFTTHEEHFEVEDDDIIRILAFWTSFIRSRPWESHSNSEACLKLFRSTTFRLDWLNILESNRGTTKTKYEGRHEDHDDRLCRWRKLLSLEDQEVKLSDDLISSNVKPEEINSSAPQSCPPVLGSNSARQVLSDPVYTLVHSSFSGGAAHPLSSDDPSPKPMSRCKSIGNACVTPSEGSQLLSGSAYLARSQTPPSPSLRKAPIENRPADIESITAWSPIDIHASQPAGKQSAQLSTSKSTQSGADPSIEASESRSQQHQPETQLAIRDTDEPFHSLLEICFKSLSMEAQSLSARTISTDLWQMRWPIFCSITLAMLSSHASLTLSFATWSLFLTFLFSELRIWKISF